MPQSTQKKSLHQYRENRKNAFLCFANNILKGEEGVFVSLDRTDFYLNPEFYFGSGKTVDPKNKNQESLIFSCFDWAGKNSHEIIFEKSYDHKSFETNADYKSFEKNPPSHKRAPLLTEREKRIIQQKLINFRNKKGSVSPGKNSETEKTFCEKVAEIQKKQTDGEIWVMNLTQNFYGSQNLSMKDKKLWLLSSFFKFLQSELSHCGGLWMSKNRLFASFSPEVFAFVEKENAKTFPIKGTGTKKFLLRSEKEKSELSMITDLVRNDWGQIGKKVRVTRERFFTKSNDFFHSQSEVEVFLKQCFNQENIQKLLPAGSISGAPKKKVIETIKSLENFDRKFYTGIFGVQIGERKSIFNILIRTLFVGEKKWYFPTGSGITIESDGKCEYQECLTKQEVFHEFCTSLPKKIKFLTQKKDFQKLPRKKESISCKTHPYGACILFFLLFLLVFLDQTSKFLARKFLSQEFTPLDIFPFFQLKFVENTGIAFSIPVPQIFTITLSIVIIFFLLYWIFGDSKLFRFLGKECFIKKKLYFLFQENSNYWSEKIALILILSGALGNTFDRIYLGKVTDFLSFWSFPIFNLADIWIFCGVTFCVLQECFKKKSE